MERCLISMSMMMVRIRRRNRHGGDDRDANGWLDVVGRTAGQGMRRCRCIGRWWWWWQRWSSCSVSRVLTATGAAVTVAATAFAFAEQAERIGLDDGRRVRTGFALVSGQTLNVGESVNGGGWPLQRVVLEPCGSSSIGVEKWVKWWATAVRDGREAGRIDQSVANLQLTNKSTYDAGHGDLDPCPCG